MKARLRPYTEFLIKENLAYIVTAIILVVATAGILYYFNRRITDLDIRIKAAQAKINQANTRRAALRSVVGESTENLDQDLQIITTLIPDSEDYFSIINALETLSQQTNFRIDSYSINLLASTSTKLSLTVTGNGDNEAFLAFLTNYQVNGGRLITAENISIDPQETGSIRLDLNFYNKKASSDLASGSANLGPALAELNHIKSKITFNLTGPDDEQPIQEYPVKSDPF